MPRNRAFLSRPPPFATHHGLRLNPESVSGSLPFFNPTHARYNVKSSEVPSTAPGEEPSTTDSASKQETYIPDTEVQWRSRDNRKGTNNIKLPENSPRTSFLANLSSQGDMSSPWQTSASWQTTRPPPKPCSTASTAWPPSTPTGTSPTS